MKHVIITRDLQYSEIIIEKYIGNRKLEFASIQVDALAHQEAKISFLFYDEDGIEINRLDPIWMSKSEESEISLLEHSDMEAYVSLHSVDFNRTSCILRIDTPNKPIFSLNIYRGEMQEAFDKYPKMLKYQAPVVFSHTECQTMCK